MTAFATVSSAVEAMRIGAGDYLTKPFALEELTDDARSIGRSVALRSREPPCCASGCAPSAAWATSSAPRRRWRRLYRILSKVARSTHPVLILGESGTGKELVARTIHASGPNAARALYPGGLRLAGAHADRERALRPCEGRLHRRQPHQGRLLAAAEGGTVFLDEIGELPLDLQAKLLRALQEKEVRPVGATHAVPISARVLAATNRDLTAMVEQGQFRKDLYFRLNVVNLKIPPLRERRDDIPVLAQYFLERAQRESGKRTSFSEDAMRLMLEYDWPGNVRELQHAIERTCAMSLGPVLHTWSICPRQLQDFRMHHAAQVAGLWPASGRTGATRTPT